MNGVSPPPAYPAIHHIGIVVEQTFADEVALQAALAHVAVVVPLHAGRASRAGTYRTLRLSVRVDSRAELDRLDHDLRAVPGVKLLL